MVYSMIVFVCVEQVGIYGILSWELCLVNYCYLEFYLCLFDVFCDFEGVVCEVLCQGLLCGKVECILCFVEEIVGKSLQVDQECVC